MSTALKLIAVGLALAAEGIGLDILGLTSSTIPVGVIFLAVPVLVLLGWFAAFELWHLHHAGRAAGVAFCVLSGALLLWMPTVTGAPSVARQALAGLAALVIVVLVAPAARRACDVSEDVARP